MAEEPVKKKRGRPRKNPLPEEVLEVKELEEISSEESDDALNLFGLDDEPRLKEVEAIEAVDLFGLDEEDEVVEATEVEEAVDLFGLDDDEDEDIDIEKELEAFKQGTVGVPDSNNVDVPMMSTPGYPESDHFSTLLTKDKKVVSFVGTTKNGTSFIVNNTAELLSGMGIKTAILDMTKSRNAYYIYTKNEEILRQTAANSISNLRSGIASGIQVNKNLSVYTSLPGENRDHSDVEGILATLVKEYTLVLIDCDFETEAEYFAASQEIFLVQSMDVLTIQPLTAFLRNLKSKNVLRQEKVKIVINKEQKMKSLRC